MAELYELRFFEDVLDWIKTLAKEDPESHLHVIAALFMAAGDKAARRQWADWYPRAVKEADDRYTAHLEARWSRRKGKGRTDEPWLHGRPDGRHHSRQA